MAGGCSGAVLTLPSSSRTAASRPCSSCATIFPVQLPALSLTQLYGFFDKGWLHNLAPVPGTFQSVDAATFGAGLRLGWLNAVTADLTVRKAKAWSAQRPCPACSIKGHEEIRGSSSS